MGRVAPPFRESPVMLRQFAVALVVLLVLDTVWLGVVMKDFYRRALAPVARMADGQLDPIWPVAALVYPVLAAGLTGLVLTRARTPIEAAVLGAFFGAVTFAVYDLTNHATLRDWRATMTVIDIAWGAGSCGAAAWVAARFS
jgi:uncharacterized membrane protein